jgi:hypothetical protein
VSCRLSTATILSTVANSPGSGPEAPALVVSVPIRLPHGRGDLFAAARWLRRAVISEHRTDRERVQFVYQRPPTSPRAGFEVVRSVRLGVSANSTVTRRGRTHLTKWENSLHYSVSLGKRHPGGWRLWGSRNQPETDAVDHSQQSTSAPPALYDRAGKHVANAFAARQPSSEDGANHTAVVQRSWLRGHRGRIYQQQPHPTAQPTDLKIGSLAGPVRGAERPSGPKPPTSCGTPARLECFG